MALNKADLKQIGDVVYDVLAKFYTHVLDPNFATKDDLKGFATKDDLKGFATKDDLKGFATKDDLKGFVTKDDLKALENKMVQFHDELIGEFGTIRDEHDVMRHRVYREHEPKLSDHEERIADLEASFA